MMKKRQYLPEGKLFGWPHFPSQCPSFTPRLHMWHPSRSFLPSLWRDPVEGPPLHLLRSIIVAVNRKILTAAVPANRWQRDEHWPAIRLQGELISASTRVPCLGRVAPAGLTPPRSQGQLGPCQNGARCADQGHQRQPSVGGGGLTSSMDTLESLPRTFANLGSTRVVLNVVMGPSASPLIRKALLRTPACNPLDPWPVCQRTIQPPADSNLPLGHLCDAILLVQKELASPSV
jgi:hypothetical protein